MNVYLFYKEYWASERRVARLSSNGLAVEEKLKNLEITNYSGYLYSFWHLTRGNRHYLIFKDSSRQLKVARSSNGVLGPYQTNNQPLISGGRFREPSVIIENGNYNLIFGSSLGKVYLVGLKWESEWPYAVLSLIPL